MNNLGFQFGLEDNEGDDGTHDHGASDDQEREVKPTIFVEDPTNEGTCHHSKAKERVHNAKSLCLMLLTWQYIQLGKLVVNCTQN